MIDVLSGDQLDYLAALNGVIRYLNETDVELLARVLAQAQATAKASYEYLVQYEYFAQETIKSHNCECGGYKTGYTEPGIGHSSWCKMSKI